MIQTILKASFHVGFVSSFGLISLGGEGNTAPYQTFGADSAKVIVPVDGVFRTLVVVGPGAHPSCTLTLMVNGVASALTCTLETAAATASDRTHAVPVVAGDDVYLAVALSPAGGNPGPVINLSLEFEGAEQWFGVAPESNSQAAGTYRGGGAFGNGVLQTGYTPTVLSATYSLCATPGTITGLRLKAYSGAPGAATWTGYLVKNSVLQDGTGSTVSTACPLTGSATQASARWTLPVAVTDRLEVALLRTGTDAPFANAQVALSVTFTPSTPGAFMVSGGNNDALTNTAVDWKWTQSQQVSATEALAQVPIARPLVLTALYIEKGQAPGAGKSVIYTLRVNDQDTAATCTITGVTATACQLAGLAIPLRDGDLLDLQLTPVGTPAMAIGLKWGVALGPPPPIPPAPPGTIDPIRRVRQAPHLWDGTSGHRLRYPGFQLLVEAGAPRDTDGPMSWVLQWSDDGGHSWSHEHRIEGSRLGEHTFRFWWRRLGQSRDRVFRVINSDDAKIVIIDALLVPDPVEGSS